MGSSLSRVPRRSLLNSDIQRNLRIDDALFIVARRSRPSEVRRSKLASRFLPIRCYGALGGWALSACENPESGCRRAQASQTSEVHRHGKHGEEDKRIDMVLMSSSDADPVGP